MAAKTMDHSSTNQGPRPSWRMMPRPPARQVSARIPMAPGTSGRRSSRTTGKAMRKSNRPPSVPPPAPPRPRRRRRSGSPPRAAPRPRGEANPAAGTRPRRGRRGSRRGARPPAWSPGPVAGRAGGRDRGAPRPRGGLGASGWPGPRRAMATNPAWPRSPQQGARLSVPRSVVRSVPSGRSRGCPGSPRTRVVTKGRAVPPRGASTTGPARRAGPGAPRGWARADLRRPARGASARCGW